MIDQYSRLIFFSVADSITALVCMDLRLSGTILIFDVVPYDDIIREGMVGSKLFAR